MTASARLEDALQRLSTFYGPLATPPHDPFAMYVWEVLNAHASPLKREAALGALRRIPALTPDSVWKTPLPRLEAAAALAGPYQDERVRALRAGADVFRRNPEFAHSLVGPVIAARRALGRLTALGQAGRLRLLLFAAGRPVVPVDAPLARVALRLGFGVADASVRRQVRTVRRALSAAAGPDLEVRRRTVLLLEHHGQSACAEYDPHCHVCPLTDSCAFGRDRRAFRTARGR